LASTTEPAGVKGKISPFEVTKYVSLGLLVVFVLVLAADVILVRRRKIVRWTSKSFAHLIFIVILLIAALTVLRGQIL
jgi:amino acid transporter